MGGVALDRRPRAAIGCYPATAYPPWSSARDGARTVTVVGDGEFMTNLRLAEDGNAALAMNLAGAQPDADLAGGPRAVRGRPRARRSLLRPGPRRGRLGRGAAGRRGPRCWRCGGAAGSARSSPSRCRSSCGRPRRSRAAPGSTGAAGPRPGRRGPSRRLRRPAHAPGSGCRARGRAATRRWTRSPRAPARRPPTSGTRPVRSAPADDAALVGSADDLDALEREVRRA